MILLFGLAATMRTAAASDACNAVNSLFESWQTFAPGDPDAFYDTSADVFEAGETLFYQAQTFGSSQAERDRDPGTSGAGLELFRIDTGETLNFEPENGMEVNVANDLLLSATAQFEIFIYGATPPGTGSVRSRLICYGATTSVASISPASGPVAGGNDVVITGAGLAGIATINFDGIATTDFTLDSATQITVRPPAHAAGQVAVTVARSGGPQLAAGNYTYRPVPTVTSLSPSRATAAGNIPVTIGGTGFFEVNSVSFGATQLLSFSVDSDSQISVTAPAGPIGNVDVTVTSPGGVSPTAAGATFTYVGAPTITSLSATQGPVGGGNSVTINGSNFVDVTGVRFGTNATSVPMTYSETQLLVAVPAGIAGTVQVEVTALGGSSNGSSYTYVAAPVVTGIAPASGPVSGSSGIVISGSNLSGASVTFDGAPATVTGNTASAITVTAPAHAAGSVNVDVTTAGGPVSAGSYVYRGLPVISGVSPSSGPLAGGNSVIIGGSGLESPSMVTFGGLTGSVTASSDTEITVTAPFRNTAGTVDVEVTTTGGISSTGAGAYTYLASPVVGSISPASGPLAGGTGVTVTGTGFTPDASVAFGAVSATGVSYVNDTTLTAQSPAGSAGSVPVTVTTPGGVSGGGSLFTYLAAPVANASAASVAANSSNNPITLNITGSALTGVAVATNAAHGNAVASGTSITYTPTAGYSGTDSFTYTATNSGGTSSAATVTITVTPPVLAISPAAGALPSGLDETAYNQSFTASGGTATYSYIISGGTPPPGLTLSPAGVLSGTPTAPGPYTFAITATDIYGATGTATYTLQIDEQEPVANPVSAVVAIGSTNNSITLSISGGDAALVTVDTQATNGTATASGTAITYTPNSGYFGPDSFTYTATNSAGTSAAATVSITVAVPTFTFSPAPGALPAAIVDSSYSQQITASGGSGTYSYAVTTGALPAGLNLSPGGLVAGTPTVTGTLSFTITATDSVSAFGSASYSLEVVLPVPVASDVTFAIAANAGATAVPLSLSGGAATSVAVASTPSHGIATASGTGISYTPAAGYSGTDSFTYTATNTSGTSAAATVTITVAAPTLALSPVAGALPSGMVGAPYSQTFVASTGTAPYSYVAGGGSVPAGLVLDASTGALAGTPTTAGLSNFTVTATDAYGATGTIAYTLDIAIQPPVANPVAATVVRGSVNNPIPLSITGGAAATVSVAAAPSNGNVTVTGATMTYTPASGYVGSDSFSYTASNPSGTSAAATVSITVVQPSLTLAPAAGPLPDGTVGSVYSQMLSAAGGTAPYSFAVTGGSLPAGVEIAPGSNLIAGTPDAAGTYSVAITATDAGGATVSATYSLRIVPAALILSPPTGSGLPPATTGLAYSYTGISASGGSGPVSFAAAGLPPGLVMAAGGAISGTPTSTGNYSLAVTATDTAGATATASYGLTVNPGAGTFVFSPAGGALPQAMVGEAYSQDISAGGGVAPLIYGLESGTLPAGLVLNVSNGDLNGPLAADAAPGTYTFAIGVRDASGVTGSASYSLVVQPRAVTVANKEVSVPPGGTPPNVYLNGGATGGPFVDALLGTVSPPSAGTAEIIRGELAQAGPVAPTGFYLRFTPNPGFSGRALVGYQLISAFGTSNLGTVAYNLNFNAVAVADDIDGLVRDFVRTRQNLLSSTIRVPGLLERRRMDNARNPVTIRMSPQEDGMRASFSTSLAQVEAARDRADGLDAAETRPFNIWIDGAIRVHGRGDRHDQNEEDDRWGSFALLSVGMDYLLSDRALIGISAHFDRMTDPADDDAELTGNGWFAGPYVSLEIAKGVFFDTSLLYGGSSNDIDTSFFDGKFDTTRWMWDGSIKGEWYLDAATVITPKLRAVYLTETVKDYAVGNDAGDRILLEGFSMEQLRASIGAEIERRIVLSNGMVWTPRLGATVGFAGLDGEGTFATITAGASLQTETAWMFDVALLFDIEGEGSVSVGARARMSTRF